MIPDPGKIQVSEADATKVLDWMLNRSGVVIWPSQDLSNLGKYWTGPRKNSDGTLATKPHWSCPEEPSRHITNLSEIEVCTYKEVKRFRVGVRPGSQGFSLKVTDGGTRKIRAAVAKAGEGACYEFDYFTQEAVILKPDKVVPLADWTAYLEKQKENVGSTN